MSFRNWIIKVTLTGLAILLATEILGGVKIDDFRLSWIIAILLSMLNAFVRPLLIVLTLPVTIFSLGLFLLVINGAIIILIDSILDGFYVDSMGWAILLSILISIFTYILEQILGNNNKRNEQ